ncbi:MAG: hypothetical protein IT443_08375 [Phycisphaeraceae bacterium]|nr:hypothetical protein [Phycisphaeraceae bacterium]
MTLLRFSKHWVVLSVLSLGSLSAQAFEAHNIPTQGGTLFRAVVSGHRVAWGERTSSDSTGKLYYRDLNTGVTQQVPYNPTYGSRVWLQSWAPWHPAIAIEGDYIVWSDSLRFSATEAAAQIRSYNIVTGQVTTIGSTSKAYGNDQYYPAISGSRVVWQGWNATGASWNMAILQADVATANSVTVAQSFSAGVWPIADVSGDWIVWKSDIDRGIYAKHGTDAPVTLHTGTLTESPRAPVVHGNIVAWSVRDESDPNNHTSSIQGYNLATNTPFTILADIGSPEHKANVSISDRYVVWEDWRHNPEGVMDRIDLDVYAYDLWTGQSFAVAEGAGVQHEAWIDGNTVVWTDEVSGTRQLMWTVIPEPTSAMLLAAPALLALARRRR